MLARSAFWLKTLIFSAVYFIISSSSAKHFSVIVHFAVVPSYRHPLISRSNATRNQATHHSPPPPQSFESLLFKPSSSQHLLCPFHRCFPSLISFSNSLQNISPYLLSRYIRLFFSEPVRPRFDGSVSSFFLLSQSLTLLLPFALDSLQCVNIHWNYESSISLSLPKTHRFLFVRSPSGRLPHQ